MIKILLLIDLISINFKIFISYTYFEANDETKSKELTDI